MKLTLEYPSELPDAAPEFLDPVTLVWLSVEAERLGFDAVALSDHPAPSARWRRSGGHDTLEPAVAMSFIASATHQIRLMTNLYVLPFRNPYLIAKALTSLDIVSGGRLIAGVGAGYLPSEFEALGVDFDSRAEIFDRHLEALISIWTTPGTPVTGDAYGASEDMSLLPPVQQPHPPLWIGGNSRAALRRVVQYGSGWSPVIAPASVASSIRTQTLDTPEKFGQAVQRLGDEMERAGRDLDQVEIQVELPVVDFDDAAQVQRRLDRLAELVDRGATRAIVHVGGSCVPEALDYIAAVSTALSAIGD